MGERWRKYLTYRAPNVVAAICARGIWMWQTRRIYGAGVKTNVDSNLNKWNRRAAHRKQKKEGEESKGGRFCEIEQSRVDRDAHALISLPDRQRAGCDEGVKHGAIQKR